MRALRRHVVVATVVLTRAVVQASQFVVNSSPPGYYDANTISDCSFWATVQSGNTCNVLEQYFNITAAEFQIYNPAVDSNCTNLQVGYSYCIQVNNGTGPTPTTNPAALPPGATGDNNVAPSPVQSGFPSSCNNYYWVSENSTCEGIVDFYGGAITQAQLVSWNPAINNCSNLLVNYFVCTGLSTANTTATPSSGPTSTSSSTSSSAAGPPQPEQTGIASNCDAYYFVKSGDSCSGIVNQYNNFTLSQFYSWNPAVGNSCGGLQAGYYVCIGTTSSGSSTSTTTSGPPSPHQTGIASNCTLYYQAKSGDTCSSIAAQNGTFSVSQFEGWNPAVGSNCANLWVGEWYCVAVPGTPTKGAPSPHQSGIASNCNQYYMAKSGDTCYSIAAQNNTFTVSQFEGWNPAVGSSCSNLEVGEWYCVGV